jgi:K+-transporting ATPase KdpF subunit
LFLIHRNLLSRTAKVTLGSKRDKKHLIGFVLLALGLGFFWWRWVMRTSVLRRTKMIFEYSLAALVAAGLLFYLIYALLRPERF